ncbi:MAG TPA: polyprenyl synthetase family protein [Clostridia bacterium]|nr:polyprenyl synthetase family protein [Clostridia bacterium]
MKDGTGTLGDCGDVRSDEERRFLTRYDEHRRRVDRALEVFLHQRLSEAGDDRIPALGDAVRYAVFPGGQRLRPVLLQEACEVAGGFAEAALPLACSIELIHSYSLIHDDLPCMDDDDFRRGRPALHRAFGEAVAVLTGDLLLTLAFEAISTLSHDFASRMHSIIAEVTRSAGFGGMLGGQGMDIAVTSRSFSPDLHLKTMERRRAFLRRTYALKTSKLFEASVVLGGLAAGAEDDVCDSLRQYGYHFGLAYQIADDISDYGFGAEDSRPNYVRSLGFSVAAEDLKSEVGHCVRIARSLGERAWFLASLPTRVLERVQRIKGRDEWPSVSCGTDRAGAYLK